MGSIPFKAVLPLVATLKLGTSEFDSGVCFIFACGWLFCNLDQVIPNLQELKPQKR